MRVAAAASRPAPALLERSDDLRLRFALQAARMYVWERDMGSTQVTRFGKPSDVLGVEVETIDDFLAHVHHEDNARVRLAIGGVIARCEPYEMEFRIVGDDGKVRWVRDVGRRVPTDTNDRFVGVCIDVTVEVEARQTALRLASHDALTGLANRTRLRERLDLAVDMIDGGDAKVAVLGIDLDNFKAINDTYGHMAGDALLVHVAELLKSVCRPGDTVSRVGGDEFALVLSPGDIESVEQAARILLAREESPFVIGGHEVFTGFSLGASIGPTDGRDSTTLLRAADIALYGAKATGRGTLCFFEAGMNAAAQRRQRIEQDLRSALARDQLSLVYQPLVDLDCGRTTGVEALMRWSHPEHGTVSPAEFIPVAESSGLILQLGEWALRTACRAALNWPGVRLSVNVSTVQFHHRGFLAMLVNVLADTGLAPERLELEVTESILLSNTDEALATFAKVKSLGVSIAMDDFGTGYSSLSYISRFAFDKIKIDASFIHNLGRTVEADAIVKAVLSLGRSLDIKINAEGVETPEQLRFLTDEGCDQVQGFLMSRPVSAGGLTKRLQNEACQPQARRGG